MPIEFQDVLKTNLVLVGARLLNEQFERDTFVSMVGTDVDVEPIIQSPVLPLPVVGNPTSAEAGLSLVLRRDRIRVDSLPARTHIEQEYPQREGLERLADLVWLAIDLTNMETQALTAFGFNIERVYRCAGEESSEMYLAKRLIPHLQGSLEGLTLAGGACKLSFASDGAQWNFVVEPRANDPTNRKVFLSLNLHRGRPQAPSREEIHDSFHQIWDRSEELAARLDGGG